MKTVVYVFTPKTVIWCSVCNSSSSRLWIRPAKEAGPTYCFHCFVNMLPDWLEASESFEIKKLQPV